LDDDVISAQGTGSASTKKELKKGKSLDTEGFKLFATTTLKHKQSKNARDFRQKKSLERFGFNWQKNRVEIE
jgi:sigma54-dependent transcription regulator